LYAKLRRYERRGQSARVRKRRADLHHVEEAIRHFAERNFLAVLAGSHQWNLALFIGTIRAATNQIRMEICTTAPVSRASAYWNGARILPSDAQGSVEIVFEEQAGWLVAGVAKAGWIENLGQSERLTLADALAGFYKLAGVDLVREQVAAVLPSGATWSAGDEMLNVWQDGRATGYALDDESALPRDRVLFRRSPLSWTDWVAAWQRDQDGKDHAPPLIPNMRVLP
jgi:hypothetical protein